MWKEFGKFEEVVISDSRNINQPVKKPKKKRKWKKENLIENILQYSKAQLCMVSGQLPPKKIAPWLELGFGLGLGLVLGLGQFSSRALVLEPLRICYCCKYPVCYDGLSISFPNICFILQLITYY